MTRRYSTLGLLAAALASAIACRPAQAEPPAVPRLQRLADIVLQREAEILRALVPARTTLASMLQSHRLLAGDVTAVVSRVAEQFDVRRLRAGQPYRVDRLPDGRIREFEYEIDHDRRVVVTRRDDVAEPAFEVAVAPIEKTIAQVTVSGEISGDTPTLVEAIADAGERIELSLALADIFSGELDFNSDVQPGDRFRLVVERATRADGAFAGYGSVLLAEYTIAGRALEAVRFTPAGAEPGYYDAEGRSVKRFFLKSPLRFEPRVTSAFSRARRHPILAYTRAHNGVDYAAPSGAPVAAVSAGVVTFAGWAGGGGRTVRVRHAGGYESEYLHLSSIGRNVRPGTRVAQGELIGRVGASGLATGPHLHYGLRRNGAYVNPVLEHSRMPPGAPIGTDQLAVFAAERNRLFNVLGEHTARAATSAPADSRTR